MERGCAEGGFSLRVDSDESRVGVTLHVGPRVARSYTADDFQFAGAIAQVAAQGLGSARGARLRRDLSEALSREIQPLQASIEINAGLTGSNPLVRSVARMKRLTSEAVDALRRSGGGGEVELEVERQKLDSILAESLSLAGGLAEAHGVQLQSPATNGIAYTVSCDRDRLVRAFARIMEGCVRAMSRGSTLNLEVRRAGDARLEIRFISTSPIRWPSPPVGSLAFALEVLRAQGGVVETRPNELLLSLPEAARVVPPSVTREKLQAIRDQMRADTPVRKSGAV